MKTINVNGIEYKEKKKPNIKNHLGKYGGMAYMMALAASEQMMHPVVRANEAAKIDIEKEYGLIQNKESTLSRSQRAYVIKVFENKYEKTNG